MLAENHVYAQVLYQKILKHDKIILCKILCKEDVNAKKNHTMENHVRRGFTVCTVREFGSRNFLCDDDVIRLYIVESFIYTKSILHSFLSH